MLVEPQRLPLPLLYEAVARGAALRLSRADCEVVRTRVCWACRSLQSALVELADVCNGRTTGCSNGVAKRASRAVVDVQEQIGSDVLQCLDDRYPDWLDEVAEETWREIELLKLRYLLLQELNIAGLPVIRA
jgi:hypothetical protein